MNFALAKFVREKDHFTIMKKVTFIELEDYDSYNSPENIPVEIRNKVKSIEITNADNCIVINKGLQIFDIRHFSRLSVFLVRINAIYIIESKIMRKKINTDSYCYGHKKDYDKSYSERIEKSPQSLKHPLNQFDIPFPKRFL